MNRIAKRLDQLIGDIDNLRIEFEADANRYKVRLHVLVDDFKEVREALAKDTGENQ